MQKNNNLKYIIAAAIVAVLLVAGVSYSLYQSNEQKRKDDEKIANDKRQKEESDKEELEKPTQAAKASSQNLKGNYIGKSASLLSAFLTFPSSNLSVDENRKFVFKADGLDIYALIKDSLGASGITSVKANTEVGGTIADNADKLTVDFTATSLKIDYFVNEKPADAAAQALINQSIFKMGLLIPTITAEKPVVLNTKIVNSEPNLTVTNTPLAPFVFSFSGTKN